MEVWVEILLLSEKKLSRGVGHERKIARAFDGDCDGSLVVRAEAGFLTRIDFSLGTHKTLTRFRVFVVDHFAVRGAKVALLFFLFG